MLNIALPKGRLGEKVYKIFEEAGYATAMIRSLRNSIDFEYERSLERANRHLHPEIGTIILLPPAEVEHISSSLVRELHTFGHSTKELLPEGIELEEYLTQEKNN